MTAEACRKWREWLGAYALGQLPGEERTALEAHLDGCSACRSELDSLRAVARVMPLADPERFGTAPTPPATLAGRVTATIAAERRMGRRRRLGFGLAFGGAAAAIAAAVLAIFVLTGSGESGPPERHVSFGSLPPRVKIGATLIPHAFGTEIHVYVKGARSGTLCRVFLRGTDGERMPAGSFRYRWGDDSNAVLSAALDLSDTAAIGVRVGERTFVAPLGPTSGGERT
jgi:Putative zinc-finger